MIGRTISLQLPVNSNFTIARLRINVTRSRLLVDEAYNTRVHVHVLVEAFAVARAWLATLAPLGFVHGILFDMRLICMSLVSILASNLFLLTAWLPHRL